MAFGKRIKFFRKRSRLTAKALGMFVGFKKKGADVRMAQYENEQRRPKEKLINGFAEALGVAPEAIRVPDIDSFTGLMHTLFAIEDMYGLTVLTCHERPCLTMAGAAAPQQEGLSQYLEEWCEVKMDLLHGKITRTQYDDWRYNYPRLEREKKDSEVSYTPLEAAIE